MKQQRQWSQISYSFGEIQEWLDTESHILLIIKWSHYVNKIVQQILTVIDICPPLAGPVACVISFWGCTTRLGWSWLGNTLMLPPFFGPVVFTWLNAVSTWILSIVLVSIQHQASGRDITGDIKKPFFLITLSFTGILIHYVRVMGRLRGIDPLFQGTGKNIDFRSPFFRYFWEKVNFRPLFSQTSTFDPPFAPIDLRVSGSQLAYLPPSLKEYRTTPRAKPKAT